MMNASTALTITITRGTIAMATPSLRSPLSQANRGLVDHAADLRRFAENRNPQDQSQSDARPLDCNSVILRSVLSTSSEVSPTSISSRGHLRITCLALTGM